MTTKLCKCGCGKGISEKRTFIHGHNAKNGFHPFLGKKHAEESIKKMSSARIGVQPWNIGKKFTLEYRERLPIAHKGKLVGKDSPNWIEDRSKVKTYSDRRQDSNYKQWRKEVYKRDNWTCKINNKDCKGRIEAHHILGWSEHSELRYDKNNGITLCHSHHPQRRSTEKELSPYFKELVATNI